MSARKEGKWHCEFSGVKESVGKWKAEHVVVEKSGIKRRARRKMGNEAEKEEWNL